MANQPKSRLREMSRRSNHETEKIIFGSISSDKRDRYCSQPVLCKFQISNSRIASSRGCRAIISLPPACPSCKDKMNNRASDRESQRRAFVPRRSPSPSIATRIRVLPRRGVRIGPLSSRATLSSPLPSRPRAAWAAWAVCTFAARSRRSRKHRRWRNPGSSAD